MIVSFERRRLKNNYFKSRLFFNDTTKDARYKRAISEDYAFKNDEEKK